MTDLEARLIADPDDVDAHLVYADWLQATGDPRGELVVVQVQLATAPEDFALFTRQRELLRKHRVAWLGELADLSLHDFEPTWRHGFVRRVRLGPPIDGRNSSEIDFATAIGQLRRMPAVEHVRELVIVARTWHGERISWAAAVAGIVAHGVPPNLTRLVVSSDRHWDPTSRTADLSSAYPRLAMLRELAIDVSGVELGALAFPELRSFELGKPNQLAVAALRTAQWPVLERLAIRFGESPDNPYGDERDDVVKITDLAWLFAGENVAAVRHLVLASSSFTDELALGLCRSRLLGQLETLDLSLGTLSDTGAAAILANRTRFAHLRRLDLSHAYLTDAVRAQLSAFAIVDDPQSPDDDYRVPSFR